MITGYGKGDMAMTNLKSLVHSLHLTRVVEPALPLRKGEASIEDTRYVTLDDGLSDSIDADFE